jgi:hypothetical protein
MREQSTPSLSHGRKGKAWLAAVVVALSVGGCSDTVPSCGDPHVTSRVKAIVRDSAAWNDWTAALLWTDKVAIFVDQIFFLGARQPRSELRSLPKWSPAGTILSLHPHDIEQALGFQTKLLPSLGDDAVWIKGSQLSEFVRPELRSERPTMFSPEMKFRLCAAELVFEPDFSIDRHKDGKGRPLPAQVYWDEDPPRATREIISDKMKQPINWQLGLGMRKITLEYKVQILEKGDIFIEVNITR